MALRHRHRERCWLPAVAAWARRRLSCQSTESLADRCVQYFTQKYGGDLAVGNDHPHLGRADDPASMTGLAQGAQPILSYNFGAHRPDRMKQVVRYNILIAVLFAVSIWGRRAACAACSCSPVHLGRRDRNHGLGAPRLRNKLRMLSRPAFS
ncbi:MAG: hypothetical protein ACLR4Z_06470 [Butyricicoccaceae bacterium]